MKTVCVVGPSDSGKTTLVERILPALSERGPTATVKSIHHEAEIDREGKDTYRHRRAGADRVVGVTPETRFGVADVDDKTEEISDTLDRLADTGYDYTVVEGFSDSSLPKLVTDDTEYRNALVTDASDTPTDEILSAIEATEDRETLASLVRRAKSSEDSPKAGAVSTFTGRVRAENTGDARTTHLEYERYDGVAQERMDAIRDELEARDGVYRVLMHHETGVVPAEEDSVYVVVLAGHREEAFRAVEDGINRLKDEVPIFKKEVTEENEFWGHEDGGG